MLHFLSCTICKKGWPGRPEWESFAFDTALRVQLMERAHYLCLTPRNRNLRPDPAQLNALLDLLLQDELLIPESYAGHPPELPGEQARRRQGHAREICEQLAPLGEQYRNLPPYASPAARDFRFHAGICPVAGLDTVDVHRPEGLMDFAAEIESQILFPHEGCFSFMPGEADLPLSDWFLPRDAACRHALLGQVAAHCDWICIDANRSHYHRLLQALRIRRLRPREYASIERLGPPPLYLIAGLHSFEDVLSQGYVHFLNPDKRETASFDELARIEPARREGLGYLHRRFFITSPDALWSRLSLTQIYAFKPDISEFRASPVYATVAKAFATVLDQKTDLHYLEM